MTEADVTDRRWDPLSSAVIWRESISHLALLMVGWWSGAGYLGLVIILAIELLLVGVISMAVYPERGIRKHLISLLSFVLTVAFIGMFVVLTYGVAMEHLPGYDPELSPFARIPRDFDLLAWAAGYSAFHMLVVFLKARRSPRPRVFWSESVLLNGTATVIALLVVIPISLAFASTVLKVLQGRVDLSVATVDFILIALLVLLHFGAALLVNKLPEKDRHEIAGTPYADW